MLNEKQLKDTTLDDNAEIYQPRDVMSEREKLKEMNFKEKANYFKAYYLFKTVMALVTVIFVGYFAYTILSPKPETVLFTAVINYALSGDTAQLLQEDISEYLEIDTETQNVSVDATFYLGKDGDVSEYTLSSEQKLSTYFFAGEIDVIIASESDIIKYANFGYLCKLTEELPTALCTSLANSFFYSETEENPISSAYGIYLDETYLYSNNGELIDKPVLGIVANSDYKQNAVEMIRYLFDQ